VVIPGSYVEREWTKHFELRDFVDDRSVSFQAVVGMQKASDKGETRGKNLRTTTQPDIIRVIQLETRIRRLEAAVREKDDTVKNIGHQVKETENVLDQIYKSHDWKALKVYDRLRDKIFPMNTKRRLIGNVLFIAITEPRKVLKNLDRANLKKCLHDLKTTEPIAVLKKIEEKISEVPKVNNTGRGLEISGRPYLDSAEKDSYSLLQALSHIVDQKWLDILIESIDQPMIGGVEFPGFAPSPFQRSSVGSSGESALREIFPFYSEIKRYANKLGVHLMAESRVLDFGCGWGRIIRFFLKDVLADHLYGIDVDPEMISLCRKLVHYGNYSVCNPIPPTEFPDDTLDIIYAYSVFSHLAEPVHIKWIEEFSRILKPGGLLVVTTEGRHFIEFCKSLRGKKHDLAWFNGIANAFVDIEAALSDYDKGKFLYSATGGGPSRPSSFYGEAVIPRAYIEREWTKYLEFRDFVDDRALSFQTMVVMQKPFDNPKAP
jgi:SAM-dependent methyltransferase/uncharacterized coiled-coil protein SlyX